MSTIHASISSCRYCQSYQSEGRRGGCCQMLGVPVQAAWKACNLAVAPFSSSWKAFTPLPERQESELVSSRSLMTSDRALPVPCDLTPAASQA